MTPTSPPNSVYSQATSSVSSNSAEIAARDGKAALWLTAVKNFAAEPYIFTDGNKALQTNFAGELRVAVWGLLQCSQLVGQLRPSDVLNNEEIADLQQVLCDSIALTDALTKANRIEASSWQSFCAGLLRALTDNEAAQILIEKLRYERRAALPDALAPVWQNPFFQTLFGAEIKEIFVYLFDLLSRLRIVEMMLTRDQPLKPSLLLFALLAQEARDLLDKIERMMSALPPDAPLAELLDGTAYVIPMELKKVYTRELIGIGETHQTLIIFAGVENSCGLLKDCFQQAVVALAQFFAPDIEAVEIFPNYQIKLEESLALRLELWRLLKFVQAAEKSLAPEFLAKLNQSLLQFRTDKMHFLMFKDVETVERFIEEIAHMRRDQEIGQVLHRFGAYLETLLGQVNMRTVLGAHPFNYPEFNF